MLSLAVLPSKATTIGLVLPDHPDFYAIDIGVNYTASTTKFEAIGTTDTYIDLSNTPNWIGDLPASYNLTAYITSAGELTNGTVTIQGDTDYDEIAETLLTGNLTTGFEGSAFGATSTGDAVFEFLFTVTGGSYANDFGGIGASGGIVLSPDGGSTFTDTWTSDFTNGGHGYVDNAPVPEPSSLLLLVLGAAMCVATHRRHKHARVP
ncbi:MAG TPA: PEP-CTERM sorting domain-containing protein [Verrucomicrobiae bacterium]|nr:PEP-CTERM sorting domain-containing protein [Verrucomicrobiae bacterium]